MEFVLELTVPQHCLPFEQRQFNSLAENRTPAVEPLARRYID
jgi:hypothetical protein